MKTTKITKSANGLYGAFLIQTYNNEEQVLNCKWFKTEKSATNKSLSGCSEMKYKREVVLLKKID